MSAIKLKHAIFGVVLLTLGLFVAQGLLGLSKLSSCNDNVTHLATNWLPSVSVTNELNTNTSDLRIAEGAHVMSTDDAGMTAAETDIAELQRTIAKNRNIYEPLISSPEERTLYQEFSRKWDAYLQLHGRLLQLSRKNEHEAAAALFKGEMTKLFNDASDDLLKLVELNKAGAKTDYETSQADFAQSRLITFLMLGLGIAIGFGAGLFANFGVSRPLGHITEAMNGVASGDLSTNIPYAGNRNELGDMAKALEVFAKGLAETERLRAEQERQKVENEAARKREMMQLADNFERSVGGIVETVSSSSSQLQAAAQTMSATAEETTHQATAVAAASEQASANVQTVASAAEELAASVSEIGRRVNESARIAAEAARDADATASKVGRLSQAAQKIGDIVGLISTIAGQTNLLALNATIEAARAGDAGKGFAVVASEVKSLADQTAKATAEISAKIEEIQASTSDSAHAIGQITETIRKMNEIATTIASAVEEQGAATSEIARNVQQASAGTTEVSSNIGGVTRASADASATSSQVLSSAGELSRQATQLRQEVGSFLRTVRTA